jgi:hypothetical protein
LERKLKYLIPNNIKKIIVNIISHQYIGFLIKKFGIKINLFGGFFEDSVSLNKLNFKVIEKYANVFVLKK